MASKHVSIKALAETKVVHSTRYIRGQYNLYSSGDVCSGKARKRLTMTKGKERVREEQPTPKQVRKRELNSYDKRYLKIHDQN